MKTSLFLSIILLTVIAVLPVSAQNTFHSKPGGGEWANPATWYEGSIPTALDSVVIQSPVTIGSYTNLCFSMLVADTGMVGWGYGGGHIIINGSIYNKGSIGTGVYILFGDIYNDAAFGGTDAVIRFQGNSHSITCAPGTSFDVQFIAEDSLQDITLKSDMTIVNKASMLGNSEMFTQNHALRVNGGSLQDCRIRALDTLLFNAIIGNLTISGNYKLKGTLDILGSLYLEEEGVNYGTIKSLYGSASDLNLAGNFVNEGIIEGSTAGNLNVNVLKSVANHGIWNGNVTRFIGSAEKHISQSSGHPLGGTLFTSDNSGTVIYLDSDVEFTAPNILLNNNTLNCGTNTLTANSMFDHGTIISESEILGNNDFWETNFEGGLRFSGNNRFSNCSTNGNIENSGHMQDVTFYGGIFRSYGFLDNKGSITGIHFNIYGNLCNTGTVTDNCIVDVVGDTTQYILLTNIIGSQCNFFTDITGISYQWMLNGTDITNQQSHFLFFNTLQLSDAGVYQCRVNTGKGIQYSREIIVNNVTSVPQIAESKEDLYAYPNPFSANTFIVYELEHAGTVNLALLDNRGVKIKEFPASFQDQGSHEVFLDCADMMKGVYFLRMEVISGHKVKIRVLKLNHI